MYTKCLIEKCEYPYRTGRKYCSTHALRVYRYGNPNVLKQARPSGRKHHPLYSTYLGMLNRCNSPTSQYYKDYGGRGIKVCDRWLGVYGFDNFVKDMGERLDGYSLDRIDNNGNYEPSNCRWSSKKEQADNRRSNKMFTMGKITLNLKQWSEKYGVNYKLVHQRIYRDGKTIKQALNLN